MIFGKILIALILLFFVLVFYLHLSQKLSLWLVRKRMEKTVRGIAKPQKEIGERSLEYWLNILNHDTGQAIDVTYAKVLRYKKHDYFFMFGRLIQTKPSPYGGFRCHFQKVFFLIAIGRSAVQTLANQEHLFRQISGSEELAAFSIYRWSEFTDALVRKGH